MKHLALHAFHFLKCSLVVLHHAHLPNENVYGHNHDATPTHDGCHLCTLWVCNS